MKATRFTESQIVAILKQQDSGQTVAQITREHSISEATFYNWRAKYGGMQVSEVKRLKELEDENRRLKNGAARADVCRTEFAERSHQRGTGKKVVRPPERRGVVRWLIDHKQISQRKACRWVGLSRNAIAEPPVIKDKDKVLANRIEQLARRHKQWGVLKIYRRLRKQGELANHKRVRRLYLSLGLSLRRKTKKRLPDAVRKPLPKATACNQCWSLDFTSDNLTGGRKFRTARRPGLNVVDDYNREALGIEVDYSLPSRRVIRLLDQLVERYSKPERIRSDNGPEFISQALQDWCKDQTIELCWIEPGKPTQNAYIERFNGTFRREVLDAHVFASIRQVRQTVDAWLVEYNTERPHQALQFMTPVEYRQAA